MSPSAGARAIAAGLAILALAGCGSTSSATPRERLNRCFESTQRTGGNSLHVAYIAWAASIHRVCREALAEGKLGSKGGLSKSDSKALVAGHPHLMDPVCEASELDARDRLGPSIAKYLPKPMMRRLGDHFCDVVFSSGRATDSDGLTSAERDRIGRRHPELLTPYCLAGGFAAWDKEGRHVLSRGDMRKVMQRVCPVAVRRGYATLSGKTDLPAARALSTHITEQMIRSGAIHPLTSD